ncbi:hypothetical protein PVK06_043220 [Gossypium arboreum]|uniref:Uncharacterized protein n=1 Tax=Gossypium arboreum TaxID=29729 RepID=A0ABR0MQF6_GOSAR|nr:hypothetical protein PVK06_043220 [Gossypium arboreum]
MRLLFLVPIRKESSTVKGFLDWYYWLVHLLGGTTPTYSVLRPYYPVLETELRHIPSLLRVWFGFSFCRCFSRSKYQGGAFFPAVSDIAMASKQKRKKKLSNPDILGTVPAEKDLDFPESAFPVRCNQQLKAIKGRSCSTGVLSRIHRMISFCFENRS